MVICGKRKLDSITKEEIGGGVHESSTSCIPVVSMEGELPLPAKMGKVVLEVPCLDNCLCEGHTGGTETWRTEEYRKKQIKKLVGASFLVFLSVMTRKEIFERAVQAEYRIFNSVTSEAEYLDLMGGRFQKVDEFRLQLACPFPHGGYDLSEVADVEEKALWCELWGYCQKYWFLLNSIEYHAQAEQKMARRFAARGAYNGDINIFRSDIETMRMNAHLVMGIMERTPGIDGLEKQDMASVRNICSNTTDFLNRRLEMVYGAWFHEVSHFTHPFDCPIPSGIPTD